MGINDIAFPHLGIYLENVPKSFSVFGFQIAFYGLIIGLGVICGVLMAVHIAKLEKMDSDIIWDFAIYAVIFSVIGARLYYVLFSWDLYKNNLLSIFNTRQGGLAIYGGVLGAFATLFVYCRIKKLSPYQIGDCGVYGLVLGQIIGRWGNFFNREAFGSFTDSLFAMRLPLDAVRVKDVAQSHLDGMAQMSSDGAVNFIQVHPTFLYEGVWNLCLLAVMLLWHKHKKYHGQMCLVYLGGYGLGRFFVEGLRTDQLLIPHTQIAVSQVLAIVMFVFAVALNAYIRFYLAKDLKKETPS
ncbi:prolipoprotein diacylglyceryl transferase [Lachnospiraceae bacterium MD335]|jgi:phosphatidylglycerol:prolipoprotein diacylglycerol transferase|nr:prolipoprotein diacylglyceryl transferase [Lachnospiraceae bacterium MD335]NDO51111.1 prolipoprotein diacylglyceryl transferase [Lachnospiraceae bacterium MD335]